MIVLCNIYQPDTDLIPHFISYYSSQGINRFAFSIFNGRNNPIWNYLSQFKNIEIIKHPFYYEGGFDVYKDRDVWNELRVSYVRTNEFYVITDLDEFHSYTCPLYKLPDILESNQCDYVVGVLTDRITNDGNIPMNIDENPSIWEQFPRWSYFTKHIMRSGADKVIMAKWNVEIQDGHHWANGIRLKPDGITYHFKWFGPIEQKCKEKLEQFRDVKKYCFYGEQQNLLDHLKSTGGKLSPMVDLHDLIVW